MRKKSLLRIGALGAVIAVALGLAMAGSSSAQEMTTYNVTIENLTSGQPFTPPVVVAHTSAMDIFETGEAASAEIIAIAENGNNDPLVALVSGASAVHAFVAGDGPVMPGASATMSIQAPAGSYLSAVFMLICTNDGFSGLDSMMLPATGSVTVDANAYDAGSEQNTEDFADMVPPCQGLVGVSSDDEGTGMSNPALAEGGVVTTHAGIQGGTDLTVADHGWSGPVARITVAAAGTGLPASGTGPVDSASSTAWLLYAAIAGVALLGFGGALRLARSRAER
ncbi:MAG: spondin domain-containing protein [Chloroflexi bacterium]|nr:spondin domain-containing protein [Chloroflexota bacterium]